MFKSQDNHAGEKRRGGCLSAFLIFIIIHSALATWLIWDLHAQGQPRAVPWALPVLLILSLADIVAAIGAWNWRKWGLVLYAISTAAGIAVGLMLTGSQLVVFHDIVPLTILGYLYKDKWAHIQ